jgi:hypothetical protein
VGHHVEVRGTVVDADARQRVAQPGQAGDTTPGAARTAADFDDDYKIVNVTSMRMISESCPAETQTR